MRILFVWPICHFSVWDVARGHRTAFSKLVGEENVRDYFLDRRTLYHVKAIPEELHDNIAVVSKAASENVLNEALYFNADVVFIVSGLNFHPIGLWLLNKVKIPAAILFTESPYEDENQAEFASACENAICFTNDFCSAQKFGWSYVPHSYDPEIHRPVPPVEKYESDVVIVGTGWKERQEFLERVNWTGINLKLYGIWPTMTPESPLYQFHQHQACVDNLKIPEIYCSSKISVNIHRDKGSNQAYSLGPRLFEVAACGTFQVSDYRPELSEVFGSSVPSFKTPEELEALLRFYLYQYDVRRQLAAQASHCVKDCTFDKRAADIVRTIQLSSLECVNG